MNNKIMICCAITGGSANYTKSPYVPITPDQIIGSAIEAADAGASVVHVHVRDPETGAASMELGLYREVHDAIRDARKDLIINLTTGIGGRFLPSADDPRQAGDGSTLCGPAIRANHIKELQPDACSLDMGTMNLGDAAFLNTPAHIREIAAIAKEAGTLTELEVFDAGHIELSKEMMRNGEIPGPGLFQLCMGVRWGAPATPHSLAALSVMLPRDATWFAFGVGRHQFPIVAMTALMGGHVRVGLEDNLYLAPGQLARSNAELVDRATTILELLGKEVANTDEAREILGLGSARTLTRNAAMA